MVPPFIANVGESSAPCVDDQRDVAFVGSPVLALQGQVRGVPAAACPADLAQVGAQGSWWSLRARAGDHRRGV